MRSGFESDKPAESITFAVKSKDPAAVGDPEIAPAPDSVSPGGSAPAETDQVYGGVPPPVVSVCA